MIEKGTDADIQDGIFVGYLLSLLRSKPRYYYEAAMTSRNVNPEQPQQAAITLIEQTALQLRTLLADLASRLRPFPSFMNMVSVQAIELEPLTGASQDRGCVVVLPNGEISELDLMVLPGIQGIREIDSVEELRELDLPPEEYIVYAASAIRLLYQELRRQSE